MTQQAGAGWAAAPPPAPALPNSPPLPAAAWGAASPPAPAVVGCWAAASTPPPAAGVGWGATSPPQLEQQGTRLKRQRAEQDEQQLHQGWQQQRDGELLLPPAQRRRRLEPTSQWLAQQQAQAHAPLFAPQHQPPLQQQAQPPDIDLAPADSGGLEADGGSAGGVAAEEPLHKRLQRGGAEVRLVLPTPLPRNIPLDLPPAAGWPQGPPCHPDSLAWAVVPYSPTAPLAELAGMPAAAAGGAGAGSGGGTAGGGGMGSQGQTRRPALRFDHERPLPDVETPMSLSVAAAPSVLIEELPHPQHPAGEVGAQLTAVGSCEAMEE
ncbi:hypothetical protein ABPG75_000485 [Micractinium tetrahymenae]